VVEERSIRILGHGGDCERVQGRMRGNERLEGMEVVVSDVGYSFQVRDMVKWVVE